MSEFDELDQVVTCKYCNQPTIYGEMIWLNGKCMCPRCYIQERAKEGAKQRTDNHERYN